MKPIKKHKPLREAFKDMLEHEQLSEAEIHKLMPKEKKSRWFMQGLMPQWSLAVMTTLIAGLLIVNMAILNQPKLSDETHQRIATEVMTNHLYMQLLDVETDSMSVLQRKLNNLGFMPKLSTTFNEGAIVLLGGRYCTLQGVVATQLHFKTEAGAIMTQYQTVYDANLFGTLPDVNSGEKPITINRSGIEMQLWQESGLLMASAKPAQLN
ncbi:MAG: hypothetical protein M1270_08415 [Gammaproteobacteria bacterium]|nr:hypothetical protein [Gammaproteobacteria bacterium]